MTIVNIALPSAQQALRFPAGDRQWVITAYALTFGSVLLLGGKLGDLAGRKRAFVAGLLGFAGASALGRLAPSLAVLVAARALQGSFGARGWAPAAPDRLRRGRHRLRRVLLPDLRVLQRREPRLVGFTAGAVIFAACLLLALVLLPSRHAIQDPAAAPGARTPRGVHPLEVTAAY